MKPETMTYGAIAEQIGMTDSSISKALKKMGAGITKDTQVTQDQALQFLASRVTPSGRWTKEKADAANRLYLSIQSDSTPGESESDPFVFVEPKPKPKTESKPKPKAESKKNDPKINLETKVESNLNELKREANRINRIRALLVLMILCDMVLLWVDFYFLLGWVGLIAAAVSCSAIWVTKELSSGTSTYYSAENAIWISFFICVGGAFLHFNTFSNVIDLESNKLGNSFWLAVIISAAFSLLSFLSLVLMRSVTHEIDQV
jgi:hypothetical protein